MRAFRPNSFALMDFVNIMAYDNSGPQHSSMNYASSALDYWLGRGLPPQKATLGVPFYARPTETPYAQIVKDNPAAAQLDTTSFAGVQINYNGIPTIQAKTRLALQRASGIMFWTLENDASGDLSLLSAIHQVVVNSGKVAFIYHSPPLHGIASRRTAARIILSDVLNGLACLGDLEDGARFFRIKAFDPRQMGGE